jgi:hypothetical protein
MAGASDRGILGAISLGGNQNGGSASGSCQCRGPRPLVIDQGVAQLTGHQARVAGSDEQVLQAGQQFLAAGELGSQACADA